MGAQAEQEVCDCFLSSSDCPTTSLRDGSQSSQSWRAIQGLHHGEYRIYNILNINISHATMLSN